MWKNEYRTLITSIIGRTHKLHPYISRIFPSIPKSPFAQVSVRSKKQKLLSITPFRSVHLVNSPNPEKRIRADSHLITYYPFSSWLVHGTETISRYLSIAAVLVVLVRRKLRKTIPTATSPSNFNGEGEEGCRRWWWWWWWLGHTPACDHRMPIQSSVRI